MHTYRKSINGRILISALSFSMMLLLLTAAIGTATEIPGENHFALGNEAYVKGDYPQAVTQYEKALDQKGYTPSILYNLGNAYYMSQKIGKAILSYERALYMDPGNADIKANLALARRNSGLGDPFMTSWRVPFNWLTLNGWTWISAVALSVFSLMVLIRGLRPQTFRGSVYKTMVFICLLIFMGAGTGITLQYQNRHRGVITDQDTALRVSPFESAETTGVVKAGKMVNLANTYEGYVFVKTAGGKSGWIPRNSVTAVLPTGSEHQAHTALMQSGTAHGDGSRAGA